MAGKWLLPRVFGRNGSLPQALGFLNALKKPQGKRNYRINASSEGMDGESFGGAVKLKLFSAKCLHWEFLRPNPGPKTKKPMPGAIHHICIKITSTALKHEAGISPQRPILALPHIKQLGFPKHHVECRGALFILTSMGISGQSSSSFAKASHQTS